MDWLQASVSTTSQAADAISELLMLHGAKGTQITDRNDVPDTNIAQGYGALFGPELKAVMPEDVVVTAWFSTLEDLSRAKASLSMMQKDPAFDTGSLAVSVQNVKEEDWAENWKQYYKPMRLGERLVVQPSWEEYQAAPKDLVIQMDPGMAFGTGTHETTRMCMMMLEKHYAGGKALDIGTGSGILAIALAKLGAPEVLAIDIDPVAAKTAQENINRNGVGTQVVVKTGDLAKDVEGEFSFITANILADIVIRLKPALPGLMAKDGLFLASGIIRDREQDVLNAYKASGFPLLHRQEEGEWVALLFGCPHA